MTENEIFILMALVAIVAIQVIFAVFLLRLFKQIELLKDMHANADARAVPQQREVPQVRKAAGIAQPAGAKTTPPIPRQVGLLNGKSGINDSINALCIKYGLSSLTLASKDGLVITSSEENAEKEAAEWSYKYFTGGASNDPDIVLLGVNHKGNELVGVLKRTNGIPDEWKDPIREDLTTIMNNWL